MSNQTELLKKTGHMSQIAYARNIIYCDGRAKNLEAVAVKNGDLSFVVAKDKCMDIIELSYKGRNINFLSKGGLQGLGHYDTNEGEAQRSIMGGLFFTCGLENVGPPENGLAMHGRIRSTPAENVSVACRWEDDKYFIRISAEMRQAMLFGENLVLRRTIETVYGESVIHIHDEITNQGFNTQPLMILYHFNIGYPLLDVSSSLYVSSKGVTGRDTVADKALPYWNVISEPVDNKPEEVFYHTLWDKEECFTRMAGNDVSFRLDFKKTQLPYFTQWKSMASGDYVMGLEPGNCHVEGMLKEKEKLTLEYLPSMKSKNIDLKITLS
ncbi:MAG: aldose 1-epimerase family protein [Proteocatella sp.]